MDATRVVVSKEPAVSEIRHIVLVSAFMALTVSPTYATQITMAADPSLSGATLIDFNSEAHAFFASMTLSAVTFSAAPGFNLAIEDASTGGTYGGTGNVLSTIATNLRFGITFGATVSAFGMVWGGANENWTVSVFDASNSLIETLTFTQGFPDYIDFCGVNAAGIKSVTFEAASPDHVKIDNFQFVPETATAVPEPGTGTLLGSMLAVAALTRYSRRRFRRR
jgi:hypothetical protein